MRREYILRLTTVAKRWRSDSSRGSESPERRHPDWERSK